MFVALLRAARPHQWVKNSFVAAPLVFAERMYDASAVTRTLSAVACFCVLSSSVYLLNDIADVEKDRAHPVKRLRPIAAGTLSIGVAKWSAIIGA
ncbi:MAG TPA: UbiA family prenyltransferase, partial [Polyangia bacterium]